MGRSAFVAAAAARGAGLGPSCRFCATPVIGGKPLAISDWRNPTKEVSDDRHPLKKLIVVTGRSGGSFVGLSLGSASAPFTRPSPLCRRVGVRTFTFEACSGFTRVTARRIAQPPKAAFVTRLQLGQFPSQIARQLTRSIDNSLGGTFLHWAASHYFSKRPIRLGATPSRADDPAHSGIKPIGSHQVRHVSQSGCAADL